MINEYINYIKLYIFLRIFFGANIHSTKKITIKINSNKTNRYGVIPNTLKEDDIKKIRRIKAKL